MKTNSKKCISILLCTIIFIGSILPSVSAINGMEIKATSADCLPGDTVVINLDLINNPGIASLKLKITYDDALALQSIAYNNSMGGQTMQPQKMSSPVTLMWVSPFVDYDSDITFATLTFKVSESAKPNSVAEIKISYDPNDIYDMSETNVSCFATNGVISIGSLDGEDEEYITPADNSKIDYDNKIIFSGKWYETSINNIVNVIDGSVEVTNNLNGYIGTGSQISLNKGSTKVVYDVVIAGDVNGDSVCDALDVSLAELVVSQHIVLSDIYTCAATLVVDKNIEKSDYQNVVNWALSDGVKLKAKHTVTFLDFDGSVLKTETVNSGSSVAPPVNPIRMGYEFVGWDKSIDKIADDTIISAQYVKLNGPTFVVNNVTAQSGEENVAVTIFVKNNPGLASIGMYVNYDPSLTLTKISYNASIGGQAIPPQKYTSPAKLTWVSPFENVTGDVVFATLYFSVSPTASGELPIELVYNVNDVYDITETNINFDVVNNSILITK